MNSSVMTPFSIIRGLGARKTSQIVTGRKKNIQNVRSSKNIHVTFLKTRLTEIETKPEQYPVRL